MTTWEGNKYGSTSWTVNGSHIKRNDSNLLWNFYRIIPLLFNFNSYVDKKEIHTRNIIGIYLLIFSIPCSDLGAIKKQLPFGSLRSILLDLHICQYFELFIRYHSWFNSIEWWVGQYFRGRLNQYKLTFYFILSPLNSFSKQGYLHWSTGHLHQFTSSTIHALL